MRDIHIKQRLTRWFADRHGRMMPWALLAACLAGYALLIPWLGFYWDDWPKLLWAEELGPGAFINIEAHRPIGGWLFATFISLFGTKALAWQIFAVIWRWLGALAFWSFLRALWPRQTEQSAWAAFLFALYPGFQQTNIALTFFPHLIGLAALFFSLGLTVSALRAEERKLMSHTGAIALAAFAMLTTDYFYGLELIRPIVIFLVLRRAKETIGENTLFQAAKAWLPYLLLVAGLFLWRSTLAATESYEPLLFSALQEGGEPALVATLQRFLVDLVEGGLLSWTSILGNLAEINLASRVGWLQVSLALGVGLASYLFLLHPHSPANGRKEWRRETLLLGLTALALSNIPAWVAGIEIGLGFPANRLTLPMAAGGVLILVGLIDALPSRRGQLIIMAAYIGLAAGFHFQIGNAMREDVENLAGFWQQFTWRAPELAAGTALLTEELPLRFVSDDSLTGSLNLVYAAHRPAGDLNAALLYLDLRSGSKLPSLNPGENIYWLYRLLEFHGNTSQALVLLYQPPACLRILDPVYDASNPLVSGLTLDAMPLSDPGLTASGGGIPARFPLPYLRPVSGEPSWCFYFQQADLARQQGDWSEVAELGDLAFQLDDSPNHASERAPFIEGYARVGRWARALELSREAYDINPLMAQMLCDIWFRVDAETPASAEKAAALEAAEDQFACALN